jgi:hypothetical protein
MDDDSTLSETTALVRRTGVPAAVPDNRSQSEKRLAVYLILASTIFERLAFYSLAINLVFNLNHSELTWDRSNSATMSFIFFGKFKMAERVQNKVSLRTDSVIVRSKNACMAFLSSSRN